MQKKKLSRAAVNIEYAAVQGVYWLLSCITFTFAAVFLQGKGYTNSQLGTILFCGNLVGFFVTPLLGAASDKSVFLTELRVLWIVTAVFGVALALILIPGKKSLALTVGWALLVVVLCAYYPFITQLSFRMGRWGNHVSFGVGRGVGSLVFALGSAALGNLVAALGIDVLPITGVVMLLLFSALFGLISVQDRGRSAKSDQRKLEAARESVSLLEFFRENKRFSLCMLGIALLYFAHSVVGNFEINVVRNVGGDSRDMGRITAFMGLCELPAMFLFDRLLRRFRCSALMKFAIVMFPLKALAMALAGSIPMLYAAHALQAVSFALITPATVRYAGLAVSRRDTGKAQTVAASAITLGATFASLAAGHMFDRIGVFATLMAAFAVSCAGAVLAFAMTEKQYNTEF